MNKNQNLMNIIQFYNKKNKNNNTINKMKKSNSSLNIDDNKIKN